MRQAFDRSKLIEWFHSSFNLYVKHMSSRVCLTILLLLSHPVAFVRSDDEWVNFITRTDRFPEDCPIDLRSLNERQAGQSGHVIAKEGKFYLGSGEVVRFWGVNGPPSDSTDQRLKTTARSLAKYGVNLVRYHGAIFDERGETDFKKVRYIQKVVAAMKAEGIYTHISIYFPLWFRPPADLAWLPGYNGQQNPFAALIFNPEFQKKHREWLRDLLTTPDPSSGIALVDEPAVFGVEIQNEDSLFFWTFDEKNIPEAQMRIFQAQYAAWLTRKHGSLKAALNHWSMEPHPQDNIAEARLGFRGLWEMFNLATLRDQDQAEFFLETQTRFYEQTKQFLREVGFKGLVHASNWATASPEKFGPLEKLSYMSGDFVDRHGYFDSNLKGPDAAWSIRVGHTYNDRSALRFDAPEPESPKSFVHPVMDPHYNDKPSMISETTFSRPNRYRTEAAMYFAAYGALQDSDCITHFAFDGSEFRVKPGFFMQPWTLASPTMLGQFPAAALIYRKGLVATGDVMAEVRLNQRELLSLKKGTPLPQDASFDELRLADVQSAGATSDVSRIDPLIHYTGRTQVFFTEDASSVKLASIDSLIDRKAQKVKSSTGELELDYRSGLLAINSPFAQGLCGAIGSAGLSKLNSIEIESDMELGCIVAVALDGLPLDSSKRILLQVMSEEKNAEFKAIPAEIELPPEPGTNDRSNASEVAKPKKIRSKYIKEIRYLGVDPWQIRSLRGCVRFKRSDAGDLQVTALNHMGVRAAGHGAATEINLLPSTVYYLIEAKEGLIKE